LLRNAKRENNGAVDEHGLPLGYRDVFTTTAKYDGYFEHLWRSLKHPWKYDTLTQYYHLPKGCSKKDFTLFRFSSSARIEVNYFKTDMEVFRYVRKLIFA